MFKLFHQHHIQLQSKAIKAMISTQNPLKSFCIASDEIIPWVISQQGPKAEINKCPRPIRIKLKRLLYWAKDLLELEGEPMPDTCQTEGLLYAGLTMQNVESH